MGMHVSAGEAWAGGGRCEERQWDGPRRNAAVVAGQLRSCGTRPRGAAGWRRRYGRLVRSHYSAQQQYHPSCCPPAKHVTGFVELHEGGAEWLIAAIGQCRHAQQAQRAQQARTTLAAPLACRTHHREYMSHTIAAGLEACGAGCTGGSGARTLSRRCAAARQLTSTCWAAAVRVGQRQCRAQHGMFQAARPRESVCGGGGHGAAAACRGQIVAQKGEGGRQARCSGGRCMGSGCMRPATSKRHRRCPDRSCPSDHLVFVPNEVPQNDAGEAVRIVVAVASVPFAHRAQLRAGRRGGGGGGGEGRGRSFTSRAPCLCLCADMGGWDGVLGMCTAGRCSGEAWDRSGCGSRRRAGSLAARMLASTDAPQQATCAAHLLTSSDKVVDTKSRGR